VAKLARAVQALSIDAGAASCKYLIDWMWVLRDEHVVDERML
jgi:hypothetical protein